jgi:hypothetical protein
MTVRCSGDSRLLEQVGEKQDFECTLTAHGFAHETFALGVRRVAHPDLGAAWSCDYSVTVTRTDLGIRHVYAGGPAHRWVARFGADLTSGAYDGPPEAGRAFAKPARTGNLRVEGCAE